MAVTRLEDERTERLRRAPFTYAAVGATVGRFPDGFASLHRSRTLPSAVGFERAAARLMTWQAHAGAGLQVSASGAVADHGGVVVLGFGLGALRITAPCRVVYVVDEPDQQGFAYGTLPGHPECGEERFVIRRRGDSVEFVIDAFSRPDSVTAKLGGPASRWVQRRITDRYLRALDNRGCANGERPRRVCSSSRRVRARCPRVRT